jgi:hypothetical protein
MARDIFVEITESRFEYKKSKKIFTESNPILTCIDAPGTGKSSLAERGLQMLSYSKNSDIQDLLNNNPLSIHISFSGDTKLNKNDEDKDVVWAISTRMLSSYFGINFQEVQQELLQYDVFFFVVLAMIENKHRLQFSIQQTSACCYI